MHSCDFTEFRTFFGLKIRQLEAEKNGSKILDIFFTIFQGINNLDGVFFLNKYIIKVKSKRSGVISIA